MLRVVFDICVGIAVIAGTVFTGLTWWGLQPPQGGLKAMLPTSLSINWLSPQALAVLGLVILFSTWALIAVAWGRRRKPKLLPYMTEIPPLNMDGNLKQVRNRHFRNETIDLDGMEFIDCTFENVTLRYEGKALTRFTNVIFPDKTPFQLSSHNPIVKQTIMFIFALQKSVGLTPLYMHERTDDVKPPK